MRGLALLLALYAASPAAWAAPVPACPAADDDSEPTSMPHVAPVLKAHGKLNVLAVGSAAMQTVTDAPPPSTGAPAPAAAPQSGFPWQMARALEASVPGLQVTMTVRGGRMLAAGELAGMIKSELAHGHFDLVIWQTGTVDAVRDAPPGDFYLALADGAATVERAGADLVLVDPQYSRFLEANANLQPYLEAMQAVAALPGVTLFNRYDIMRAWADSGAIDLEHAAKASRAASAAKLHLCLGRWLAHILTADISPHG